MDSTLESLVGPQKFPPREPW